MIDCLVVGHIFIFFLAPLAHRHEQHGKSYIPLKWSNGLKEASREFAELLADTGEFYHDPNNEYGENLAFNSGGGGRHRSYGYSGDNSHGNTDPNRPRYNAAPASISNNLCFIVSATLLLKNFSL